METPGLMSFSELMNLPGMQESVDRTLLRMGTMPDYRPTWDEIATLVPELRGLLREARTARGECANRIWYGNGGMKERLCRIVGWMAESDDPRVWSSGAYEIAYRTVYNALPDCDHEGWC